MVRPLVVSSTWRKSISHPLVGVRPGGPLRPLDDAYAVAEQVLVQPELVHVLHPVDAVQVDVVQRYATLVLGHHHEGGASGILVAAQPPQHPLGEAGLARSQLAGQEEDVARRGACPHRPADGLGPLGAVADDLDLHRPGARPSRGGPRPAPRRAAWEPPRSAPRTPSAPCAWAARRWRRRSIGAPRPGRPRLSARRLGLLRL